MGEADRGALAGERENAGLPATLSMSYYMGMLTVLSVPLSVRPASSARLLGRPCEQRQRVPSTHVARA